MKQWISLVFCYAFLAQLSPVLAQQFTCTPEKPAPGETLTIHYDPTGSKLEGVDAFDAVAYFFEPDQKSTLAVEIPLKKEGNVFIGTLPTDKNAKAVLFNFEELEQGRSDNNRETGYKVLFYQTDRTTPVQGAYAAKSMIYGGFGYVADIKPDREKALTVIQKEFETHPASMENTEYFSFYAFLGSKAKNEAVVAATKDRIQSVTSGKKATEAQMIFAKNLAASIGDEEQVKSIETAAVRKFPKGKAAMSALANSFYEKKALNEKVAVFEKLRKNYGADEDAKNSLKRFAGDLAGRYAAAGDWTNFDRYFGMMTDPAQKAGVLNELAWDMSGGSIEAEGNDLEKAKALSAQSLQLLEQEARELTAKPASRTSKQYRKNMGFATGMYADTYALLAYKTGDAADALKYQQIAGDLDRFSSGEMNERYCLYLESVKGAKEAETLLADFILKGKGTTAMKTQHKRLFLANNTLESAYDKYLVQMEKAAFQQKKEEVKAKMIEEAAPDFKLINLKGEEVSLAGLKGKVVVVDFWATWCGPCIASFPGMQQAVNKFAESEDVEFVFIDTWESGNSKEKNAADFITSKSYTFNVLMDNDNETVTAFGVSGIPTKFVVDKNGKIRFKSVGFGGSDSALVDELTAMIELAGGSVPVGLTSAP